MMDKYRSIAKIMCDITDEIITESLFEYNNIKLDSISLNTRVGSGLATYCKHERKDNRFTITYGKKMVQSKFSQSHIKHWLTYREIITYNYFDSDTSLINVLTHTICHEFSHLIQQLTKEIKRGSIHNSSFYRILNTVNDSGLADEIRTRLHQRCNENNITLDFDVLISNESIDTAITYSVNDEISFIHKKKKISGTIIKINRKTLIVSTSTLFKKTHWKVPKHLIEKVIE